MKKLATLILLFIMTLPLYGQEEAINIQGQHQIIPAPVLYTAQNGDFVFEDGLTFNIQTDDDQVTVYVDQFRYFLDKLGVGTALTVDDKSAGGANLIQIIINQGKNAEIGEEGYELEVSPDKIIIKANQPAGVFYAFQTLRQLMPAQVESEAEIIDQSIKVQACKITDYPRFKWRGLMFDVSRHFFTVDEVKAFLDRMAMYKFNTFHWHLTDDEGWRIEIKSLPKLTKVGAWRAERFGRFGAQRRPPAENESTPYGGFYTHDDIREVVAYAQNLNITIVPEIDMPGHSMAALAAYPELATVKARKFVNPGAKFANWFAGGFKMLIENTLNPADEAVYKFADQVFTEIAELFPGEYIHMGGDEAYHGYWEIDPEVRAFMYKNGIKNSHELQSYFVGRIGNIITNKGKTMIGWDEIMAGGLAKGSVVMSWRGLRGGIAAAKMGHQVVMSPTTFAYLDYTQGDRSVENPIYASLSLEKSYQFEPVPAGVDSTLILGGQGNLWTEAVPNLQFAFYMAYPRAFAISETMWSPRSHKNWDGFMTRTLIHFERFSAGGTNISHAVLDPIITVYFKDDKLMCRLENSVPGSEIFYTIDNTYPMQFGEKYTGEFVIPEGRINLQAQVFINGTPAGRTLLLSREDLVERANK